jgi:hypothetical protein
LVPVVCGDLLIETIQPCSIADISGRNPPDSRCDVTIEEARAKRPWAGDTFYAHMKYAKAQATGIDVFGSTRRR